MRNVTLDQLVALNDEMAALARAGVPLESGLVHLGEEMPGRLGKLAKEVGRRMESGESLSQVVSATDGAFPPLYQAVVEAGIRGGRLSVALEGLSSTLRQVAQLRRLVGISLLYPLTTLAVAYAVFVFTISFSTPVMAQMHSELGLAGQGWLQWLVELGRTSAVWWPWPPLVAILLLVIGWFWSERWSPLGGLIRAGRIASFAEVLKLLVEQEVPLDEAIVLSADASGDAVLQRASREIAEHIRQGRTDEAVAADVRGFPSLLGWLITSGTPRAQLIVALDHVSRRYQARVRGLSDWMTVYFPIVLAAGAGGVAALLLVIGTLGPWFQILFELGQP